ncbi:hypothetical protein K2Z83_26080, partial [Oscillochloris sp. ZM17-4]|uniref:hypothetical protein n=1 Tax=Oscillochloris sp. ZM17-4 TaxID=2866714 RepID=UPI001C734EF1
MMRFLLPFRTWLGHRTWPQRLIIALVSALGLLLLAPTRPAGACGIGDMGCGVDQAMYNSMLIAARLLWTLNRLLLLVAYLLDIIRYEIIANLFLSPYTQLTALVGEAIIPVATLAIFIAILAVLLAPFTGMGSPFSVRQILLIVMVAPPLLLGMGTGLGELDNL